MIEVLHFYIYSFTVIMSYCIAFNENLFYLYLVQACYVLLGGSLHVQYPLDQNFRIKFLLGKIFCLGLQSITKKPVHEHEHLAEFEVWCLILLSHHEVLGITYLPLLAYEINPFNLSFVRLSKLISGIGLSNQCPSTSWWLSRITIKLQLAV